MNLDEVREALLKGQPVMVYDFDGREEEVDVLFYAGKVDWRSVNFLRKHAGGLICYVTGLEEAEALGLKFMSEMVKEKYPRLARRPGYGDEPAFSIYVNHVSTRTGISDEDRAKTIRELHEVVRLTKVDPVGAKEKFYSEFYSPGHVPILVSRGLDRRKGHTELVAALLELVGLERSGVIAEVLDDGASMRKEKAFELARHWGIPFVSGKEIVEAYKK
ncbi:MAG: 3,4-dihydroxy-2-butanone-4-phosphate synthase [Thermoprotei archaeon]